MSEATADWDEIAGGKAFISDTGAEVKATVSGGASMTLGRYAAWAPRTGDAVGHQVMEVSSDLDALMKKYNVPRERVLSIAAAAPAGGTPEKTHG